MKTSNLSKLSLPVKIQMVIRSMCLAEWLILGMIILVFCSMLWALNRKMIRKWGAAHNAVTATPEPQHGSSHGDPNWMNHRAGFEGGIGKLLGVGEVIETPEPKTLGVTDLYTVKVSFVNNETGQLPHQRTEFTVLTGSAHMWKVGTKVQVFRQMFREQDNAPGAPIYYIERLNIND